jgi:hypothetical protein
VANLRTEQYAGSQSSHLTDLPSYISGYVDGEGCFTVSVSQNGDRCEVLLEIQDYFGCGTIRPDRSDKTVKWEARSLPLLIERVIPHFHREIVRWAGAMNPSGKRRYEPERILRSLLR